MPQIPTSKNHEDSIKGPLGVLGECFSAHKLPILNPQPRTYFRARAQMTSFGRDTQDRSASFWVVFGFSFFWRVKEVSLCCRAAEIESQSRFGITPRAESLVQGLGLRLQGFEFMFQGLGHPMLLSGYDAPPRRNTMANVRRDCGMSRRCTPYWGLSLFYTFRATSIELLGKDPIPE